MEKEEIITIQHPNEFRDGVRILMRTLRSKEGGKVNNPDRIAEKVVTRNRDEFYEAFNDLMARRKGQERIYSTVDPRDMEKAIRIFKERQLEADYYDDASRHSFYVDVSNRWISALASPRAAIGTLFMVDVDDGKDELNQIIAEIANNKIEIVHEYKTKNGTHLILKPFNPNLVTFDVQKNGMMLLVYNNYHSKK